MKNKIAILGNKKTTAIDTNDKYSFYHVKFSYSATSLPYFQNQSWCYSDSAEKSTSARLYKMVQVVDEYKAQV